MKNKILSTPVYLVINFLLMLIVNIVAGKLFGREQLIDWFVVLVATAILTIFNARAIGRTAVTLGKDGFGAAMKTLFLVEKR